MSSECTRVECPECLPLFRYFVNQQPAVFNQAQVITPECPIGYDCLPADPIIVPVEEQKIVPDLPPYDPDIDPDCDYDCEVNIINGRDIYSGLRPRALVRNNEQTATCSDIGLDPTGTATEVVPAGTITLSYQPGVELQSVKQAEADLQAFELAKFNLLVAIALGSKFCTDPGTPDEIWQTGLMENVGSYDFKYGDPVGRTVIGSFGPASLSIISNRDCETITFTVGPPSPLYYNHIPWSGMNSHLKSVSPSTCLGTESLGDIGSSGGSYVNGVSCVSIVSTASGLANMVPLDANAETLSIDKDVQLDMTGLASAGTMNLTIYRTGKPTLSLAAIPLKIQITNWSNVTALVFGSLWANSGDTAFPGTFVGREYFGNVLHWTHNTCGGYGPAINYSVDGKDMFTAEVKWVNDLVPTDFGQPAGPNITGWMVELFLTDILAGNKLAFAAYSLSATPLGEYTSKPDATNHQLETYKGQMLVATTIALPTNTLAAGVLTASGNGEIPPVDGITLANTNKVLVKDEPVAAKNGPYVVTDIGSAGTPWILTRDTTLDADAELQTCGGWTWKVTAGTTNPGIWYATLEGTTIDTDPIGFASLPIISLTAAAL